MSCDVILGNVITGLGNKHAVPIAMPMLHPSKLREGHINKLLTYSAGAGGRWDVAS